MAIRTIATYYSENFEGYSIGQSLIGAGDQQWTQRTGTPAFAVAAGQVGNLTGSDWDVISCNDSDLTTLGDQVIRFRISAAAGGRFIFGFHISATNGIWCQILPGSQMRLYKVTNGNGYDFINSTLNLIANWDADAPPSFPCDVVVTLSGNDISIQVCGGNINTITETSAPTGTFAMANYDGGQQIDDITITLETTVPDWIDGYPQITNIARTTANVLVKANLAGTAYFVCLPAGSAIPTSDQVKAGTDANNNAVAAGLKGNAALTAGTAATMSISGLSAATNYAVYAVAENSDSYLQIEPAHVGFKTLLDNSTYFKRSLLRVESVIEFKLNLGTTLDAAQDISKYIVNIGDVTEKLSKSAVNAGGVLLPTLNIKLDNRGDRFNRDSGYFKNGFINGSSITITTHYIDADGNEITPEFVFTGLIKYISCEWDRTAHIFETTLIPSSSLLATEKIQPGILANDTFRNIIYKFMHRQPFTKYLTVSLSNINLGWDVSVTDSVTEMANKTPKEVLDEIMLLTGSVYYVNYDQEFVVEPITPTSPAAVCTFRGEDIQKITSEKYDWKGQYTALKWDDGTNAVQRVEMTYPDREKYQYDYVELDLNSKAVTNTTNRSTILNNLLDLYKFLKRKIVLTCKWNPDVLVNDYISLDIPEEAIIGDEFMVWNKDQWNDGKYWGIESPGISFISTDLWRVLEIKRDTQGKNMQLTIVQLYSDDEV